MGDRADTSRKILKGKVGGNCPEVFGFGPLGEKNDVRKGFKGHQGRCG